KIDSHSTTYSSSVIDYFESDLKKELKIIRMRLTEFKASRYLLSDSNQKAFRKLGIEPLNHSVILDKLRFIDGIIAKYTFLEEELSPQGRVYKPIDIPVESLVLQPKSQNISRNNLDKEPRSKTDTTGVLPRSIFNTINRLQAELDPQAEQNVVQNFRTAQKRTIISVRFILLLIIVPILTHQLSKAFVVGPIIDHFRNPEQAVIFLNEEMEEKALLELQRFEEKIKFENLLSNVSVPIENIEAQIREKAEEIAGKFRQESDNAVKNVFAD
ncbi:proton extrusion protein PcxA, partial [Fischerella thermalis CCMEE 5196]